MYSNFSCQFFHSWDWTARRIIAAKRRQIFISDETTEVTVCLDYRMHGQGQLGDFISGDNSVNCSEAPTAS